MSLKDSVGRVAIAAADALERTAGPKTALAAWKQLAMQPIGAEGRATAMLRALDCAIRLRDAVAARELAELWPRHVQGDRFPAIAERCATLVRSKEARLAASLAGAEAQRQPSARALYLRARCLELAGDASCAHAAAQAAERALVEGSMEIAAASRARRAAWLARSHATLPEALAEAANVDSSLLSPENKLALAEVLLASPSRFSRASGIDLLDRLAQNAEPEHARAAVERALRHADDAWPRMSPLETERLLALIARHPDVEASARWRQALRDLLDGIAPSVPDEASRLAWSIVEALESGRPADAIDALEAASVRVSVERRAPCTLWTAAESALGSEHESVRVRAHELTRRLLQRIRSIPPRGFTALAHALDAAGFAETALVAAHAGAAQKEPGARALAGAILRERGWALAREGAKLGALEALREARAMLES